MIHQQLIDLLLFYTSIVMEVPPEVYDDCFDGSCIDFKKREIYIQTIHYLDRKDQPAFDSRCYISIEDITRHFYKDGRFVDGYGSVLVDDTLLLNNSDADFYEDSENKLGFCNILGFASVTVDGLVRFSQIVYSFKFKRLLLRDDVTHQLPFKVDLDKDLGGKRAVYKHHNILSIRTNLDVYKKADKKYHQSDRFKNTLSYPRLIINL